MYDLKNPFDAPDLHLPGKIFIEPTTDELLDTLSQTTMDLAFAAVKDRGVFHLALSGGSTPEPFYIRLCTDPRFRLFPWPNTHVWMVDERRVPDDDDKLNFKMIKALLVDHVPIVNRNVHPMPVMEKDAAERYEATLKEHLPSGKLDFALMGMGDDGHTASLFPGSAALKEAKRWVVANDGKGVTPPPRLTLTYPMLNSARYLAMLITGGKKAAMLRNVEQQLLQNGPDVEKLPITGLVPTTGTLAWFLDDAAAKLAKEA